MQVGLFLVNQQHRDVDMVAALDAELAMVRAARDAGWDSVFGGQHYLNEGDSQQLQLVPFLARLAADAGDMSIGLGVLLLNLHNPVYVAETVASLDVITRGRLIFGIGLGYREAEFDAFRVPKGQRVARFEECLEVVKRLWTEERVTHDSEVTRLEDVRMNIRPVQRPYPPIWIAANSDAAVQRAARLGDAWFINPHATTETISRQLVLFREERERHGLAPVGTQPCFREIFCAPDRETALRIAGPALGEKYATYALWGQDRVMPEQDDFTQPFAELMADRFVIGTPEDCYEQLRPWWEQHGVDHFVFRTHWAGLPAEAARESMQLISRELLPALHALR
jgi:alkanesulfonate monooxygenase SsuD/methylene tetrahydromethanopterin reductase-like flavin-dependent oxidoreductase (luciferase family)